MKALLANLPIIANPITGQELQLYLTITEEAINVTLIKEALEIETHVLYQYGVAGAKTRYQQIEKVVLVLLTAVRRFEP